MVPEWIAVGIGAAGAAAGIVAGGGRPPVAREEPGVWKVAVTVAVATVFLFALTWIKSPYSPGVNTGYGILIGGLLGAVAGMAAARARGKTPWGAALAAAALASLALLGGGLILLLFGAESSPVLGGFLAGAVLAAVLFRLALPAAAGVELWALTAATVGATLMLATFRFDAATDFLWWRAPLMVLSAAVVAQAVGATAAREGKGFALPALIASCITLGLVALFAWRVFPDWDLLWVAAAGAGTFALAAWLSSARTVTPQAAAVTALIVVAYAAVGFRLLGGFGVGVGLLTAWPLLMSLTAPLLRAGPEPGEGAGATRALSCAVFVGCGVLLYRLFLELYAGELPGLDLYPHYTFVALVFGAVFPVVLQSLFPSPAPALRPSTQDPSAGRLTGGVLLWVLAVSTPLVLLIIWGFKAALGFFAGSVAAEVFILFCNTGALQARGTGCLEAALLTLAAQISAVQFSGLFKELTHTPRLTKAVVLAAAVAAGLILVKVWSVLNRSAVKEE
ncbi:MAG: hypothetical protein AB1374_12965 [Bacillota bacterium]